MRAIVESGLLLPRPGFREFMRAAREHGIPVLVFSAGVGDLGYALAFQEVVEPVLRQFDPQFVIERMPKGYDERVGDWKFTLIAPSGMIVGESRGQQVAAGGEHLAELHENRAEIFQREAQPHCARLT